jgi:LysM repeat protein
MCFLAAAFPIKRFYCHRACHSDGKGVQMLRRKKMQDYIKRLLIAGLMALCISLLFLGGKHSQAEMLDIPELTSDWIWPADGKVTDLYGTRHGHHKGIDIASDLRVPIHTVDDGVVSKSYYSGSYGHVVFIKHANNLETVYAHLNKRNVREGQVVQQGDVIGEMGNTGDSSGVHLHFEVHKENWTYEKKNAVNPLLALGNADIGQSVAAFTKRDNHTLETIAKLRMTDGIEIGNEKPKNKTIASGAQPAKHEVAEHTVQSGETLWSLAIQYNTTVEAIAQRNPIQNNQLTTGQILVINAAEQNRYVVSAGESLISIAKNTKTSVQNIKRLNGLTTDIIKPQQILRIR